MTTIPTINGHHTFMHNGWSVRTVDSEGSATLFQEVEGDDIMYARTDIANHLDAIDWAEKLVAKREAA